MGLAAAWFADDALLEEGLPSPQLAEKTLVVLANAKTDDTLWADNAGRCRPRSAREDGSMLDVTRALEDSRVPESAAAL